jgi:hypothetical protein
MKHKMKKYAIGGPTKYMDDDSDEGMSMSKRRMSSDSEGMSFSEAFRAARKAGDSTFTWRGKKYTTEMAGEKKPAKPSTPKVEVEKTETKVEMPSSSGARGYRGSKPGAARVGTGRYDDPTSTYGKRVTAPFRKLGDIFGLRREEDVMRRMGVGREEARSRLGRVEGMKRGGMVKSSASKRADGIAKKGKTRGKIV